MPEKKKKNGRQNIDWNTIKVEYITDPTASLRKMAKKYGVSLDNLAKKSKAESWFASRKEHQNKIVTEAITQTGISQVEELSKSMEYLHMLSGQMEEMLSDKDQFKKHFLQDETLAVKETIATKYDTKAMKDSFQMLKMLEDLSRSLLDIQRLEALQKHQIDVDRLQLEREKFEFEKMKADLNKPDKSNSIRIDGYEEGWSE